MSDTHGYHKGLEVPEGDVLIHCGDATGDGNWGGRARRGEHQFSDFVRWFRRRPHPRKFFVEGNHESCQQTRLMMREHLLSGSVSCSGLLIHGLPYSRSRHGHREIPSGVDVLVSHEPPYGVLDDALKPSRGRPPRSFGLGAPNHAGSRPLRGALAALGEGAAPRLHLFGHIHEARGIKSTNGTVFANVANANPGVAKCLHHGCMVFDVATDGSGHICIVKESSEGLKIPKPASV